MSRGKRDRQGRKGGTTKSRHAIGYAVIALAVAALALWTLVDTAPPEVSPATVSAEPLGEIGDESREQLREILRGADSDDRPEAR
jgi:hypothetical protein